MTSGATTLARELARPANLMSLVRVPMALVVVALRSDPIAVLALMAAAGVSDMLDGWMARHADPDGDHRIGAWLDPACDKAFVLGVLIGTWIEHDPPLWMLALTVVREVWVGVPVIAHFIVPGRHTRPIEYRSRPSGKLTTIAQFVVLLALVFDREDIAGPSAIAAALLGTWAGIEYIARAHRAITSA